MVVLVSLLWSLMASLVLGAEAIVEEIDVKLKFDLKVVVFFDAVLRLSLEDRKLKDARSISIYAMATSMVQS